MKKIALIVNLLLILTGMSFAQTTPATSKPKTQTVKTATPAAGPTKKDGTPDMRYKANKDAAKNVQTTHLKKDGTPDKRFKENKTAPVPKKTN